MVEVTQLSPEQYSETRKEALADVQASEAIKQPDELKSINSQIKTTLALLKSLREKKKALKGVTP